MTDKLVDGTQTAGEQRHRQVGRQPNMQTVRHDEFRADRQEREQRTQSARKAIRQAGRQAGWHTCRPRYKETKTNKQTNKQTKTTTKTKQVLWWANRQTGRLKRMINNQAKRETDGQTSKHVGRLAG